MKVHGYKVFNHDWTCSPNGNLKQYTCPGKFEEDVDVSVCHQGMHFCRRAVDCFNYYSFNPQNKVAEVIAYGKISENGDKCCTDKLQIVREIPWSELLEIVNTGVGCTGYQNSGDYNSGDYNSGDYNSGDWNSGNWNSGNYNSGNWNSGDYNSGDWNQCDHSNGCFNTESPKIFLFDKPTEWTFANWEESRARIILSLMPTTLRWIWLEKMSKGEKQDYPNAETTSGYLKRLNDKDLREARQKWYDGLSEKDKKEIKNLPNFNRDIFKKITGIDVG